MVVRNRRMNRVSTQLEGEAQAGGVGYLSKGLSLKRKGRISPGLQEKLIMLQIMTKVTIQYLDHDATEGGVVVGEEAGHGAAAVSDCSRINIEQPSRGCDANHTEY